MPPSAQCVAIKLMLLPKPHLAWVLRVAASGNILCILVVCSQAKEGQMEVKNKSQPEPSQCNN
jgi:hypothetical protein